MSELHPSVIPDIRVGSVVQLRSGSHGMVIEAVDGDEVSLVWADKGRLYRENLKTELLKRSTAGSDMILVINGLGDEGEGSSNA